MSVRVCVCVGGECRSCRGRHALHAGDDGALQPAAERAASPPRRTDHLAPLFRQSGTDRRSCAVRTGPFQEQLGGE